MSNFQVTFTKETEPSKDYGWELSVTHNGYQWTTISMSLDEAMAISKEITRVFGNYVYHLEKQAESKAREEE